MVTELKPVSLVCNPRTQSIGKGLSVWHHELNKTKFEYILVFKNGTELGNHLLFI